MRESLQSLLAVLDKLIAVYAVVLDLFGQQQQALVENDLAGLDKVTGEMQVLLLLLRDTEKKRAELHTALAQELGLAEDCSASDLASRLSPEESSALTKKCDELAAIIEETTSRREQNKALLNQSLKFVNFSLSLLTQDNKSQLYGKQGKRHAANRSLLKKDM